MVEWEGRTGPIRETLVMNQIRKPQTWKTWAASILLLCGTAALTALADGANKAVEIDDLKENPHRYWAMAIGFEDVLVEVTDGFTIGLAGKYYESFQTQELGTIFAAPAAAEKLRKLETGKPYLFYGTVKQRRKAKKSFLLFGSVKQQAEDFSIVVEDVVVPVGTYDDLQQDTRELQQALVKATSDVSGTLQPVLRMLRAIEQSLSNYAREKGVEVGDLFEPKSEFAGVPEALAQKTIRRAEQREGSSVQQILADYLTVLLRDQYRPDLAGGSQEGAAPVMEVAEVNLSPDSGRTPKQEEPMADWDILKRPDSEENIEESVSFEVSVPRNKVKRQDRVIMVDEQALEDDIERLARDSRSTRVDKAVVLTNADLEEFPGLEDDLGSDSSHIINNDTLDALIREDRTSARSSPEDDLNQPVGMTPIPGFVPGFQDPSKGSELEDEDITQLIDELARGGLPGETKVPAGTPSRSVKFGPFHLPLAIP